MCVGLSGPSPRDSGVPYTDEEFEEAETMRFDVPPPYIGDGWYGGRTLAALALPFC